MALDRAEIIGIAKKLKDGGKSVPELAKELKVSPATIRRWARRLRVAGYDIPKFKPGRKAIEL